jgi:Hyaluronidase
MRARVSSVRSGKGGWLAWIIGACMGLGFGLVPSASAQPASGEPFEIYWNTTTNPDHNVNPNKIDWRSKVNLEGLPERQDIVIFYEQHVKGFEKKGPMKYWTKKGMKSYLQSVKDAIDVRMPDPTFSGYGIFDYEAWGPAYELTPAKVKEAWEAEQLQLYPQLKGHPKAAEILQENYEKVVKAVFLQTLQTAKKHRPNAKWGFFDYPQAYQGGDYGKPEPNKARAISDRIQWLFDEVDVLCPGIYEWKKRVPEGQATWDYKTEWSPEQHRIFHRTNIREAKRVSGGKPVMPYIWPRYHPGAYKSKHGYKIVEKTEVDEMLKICKEEKIDGVIVWESFDNKKSVDEVQGWLDDTFIPLLKEHGLISKDGSSASGQGSPTKLKTGEAVAWPMGDREDRKKRDRRSGVVGIPDRRGHSDR